MYDVEDDGTFKKFRHKKDITRDLYYNVFCGDVADMVQKVPKRKSIRSWLQTYHMDFVWLDHRMMMNRLGSNNWRRW